MFTVEPQNALVLGLDALDPGALGNARLPVKPFTQEETREIVFKLMLDEEIHHTVQLDGSGIGIGEHLAVLPLPHHRAYGSVPRRFGQLSSHGFSR